MVVQSIKELVLGIVSMITSWEPLRRFGLEDQYCQFPNMLSNVSILLRSLTLDIDGRYNKPIKLIIYMITTYGFIAYAYTFVFGGLWFPFYRCYHTGDIAAAMIVFSLNITSDVSFLKLFYMKFLTTKLKRLSSRYLQVDSQIDPGSRFSKNMTKALRQVKKRGIIYWLVLMVNGGMYWVRPLVTPGRHFIVDIFVIYGLEPMFETPNYEIACVIISLDIIFICYTVGTVSQFMLLILGYTESHMLALSEEMLNLWNDANEHYQKIMGEATSFESIHHTTGKLEYYSEKEIVNEYIRQRLTDIIEKHATNKDILSEIEDTMRGPNAIGFLMLIIGVIAELLGGLGKTWLQVPFTLIQIGVDCYLGQKIMDSNIVFENAVYDCKWENFSDSNKKIVLMILQNAQKTMMLSAGGMAMLTFQTYMSIIKASYSAYTTLSGLGT